MAWLFSLVLQEYTDNKYNARGRSPRYQAVRVTQPCENSGSPRLEARVHNGFVYGYTATNTGSCHSGWFTMTHTYNRDWRLVARYDYSE